MDTSGKDRSSGEVNIEKAKRHLGEKNLTKIETSWQMLRKVEKDQWILRDVLKIWEKPVKIEREKKYKSWQQLGKEEKNRLRLEKLENS